jgi:hypothetical protein
MSKDDKEDSVTRRSPKAIVSFSKTLCGEPHNYFHAVKIYYQALKIVMWRAA